MLANLENYAQNLIRIIGNSRNSMPDLRNSRTRLGAEMRHSIISTLAGLTLVAGLVAPLQAEDAQGPELVDNPPERHVVVKGDTLWGISKRFLKDPWRWPDIWGLNKDQVRNPHLIYPGNVILLDLSGASPRLRLEADGPGGLAEAANGTSVGGVVKLKPKVRSQQLTAAAIPSIPASVIEPFLNRPLIISTDQFDNAPRIVATPESRVLASQGDPVYVKGVPPSPSTVWQVYRRSKVLMDPLSGEELGFEVIYLGDTQLQAFADVTTMKILRAAQEIGVGDRLVEAPPSEVLAYAPRSPASTTQGLIISAPETTITEIGQYRVVVVNLGARNGLEPGHVLALHRAGQFVRPRRLPSSTSNDENRRKLKSLHSEYNDQRESETVLTPEERYGTAFVFRVFEKVSYALIMNTTRSVNLGDIVRAP